MKEELVINAELRDYILYLYTHNQLYILILTHDYFMLHYIYDNNNMIHTENCYNQYMHVYVTYIHIHIYWSIGKTSILLRYTKGEYSDRQVSTLQASYLDKRVMINTTTVQLSIWDTAGQERFHALGLICYILKFYI